jgi:hypothetical protein
LSGIKGKHPWRVNFITYSGHGITFEGDAIAILSELDNTKKERVPRFINFSKYARYLAFNENNLNIFILSMNRVQIPLEEYSKILGDKSVS